MKGGKDRRRRQGRTGKRRETHQSGKKGKSRGGGGDCLPGETAKRENLRDTIGERRQSRRANTARTGFFKKGREEGRKLASQDGEDEEVPVKR